MNRTNLILIALRVDKKTLPAKLLKATLEKQYAEWCKENGRKRCPKDVREQKREDLEAKWLKRALPRVQTIELCLNLKDNYVILQSFSDTAADRVRKRFYATFGLRMVPESPLDGIADNETRQALIDTVPSRIGEAIGVFE